MKDVQKFYNVVWRERNEKDIRKYLNISIELFSVWDEQKYVFGSITENVFWACLRIPTYIHVLFFSIIQPFMCCSGF